MNKLEQEIEENLNIMEKSVVNPAQVFVVSTLLANYTGEKFNYYINKLRELERR